MNHVAVRQSGRRLTLTVSGGDIQGLWWSGALAAPTQDLPGNVLETGGRIDPQRPRHEQMPYVYWSDHRDVAAITIAVSFLRTVKPDAAFAVFAVNPNNLGPGFALQTDVEFTQFPDPVTIPVPITAHTMKYLLPDALNPVNSLFLETLGLPRHVVNLDQPVMAPVPTFANAILAVNFLSHHGIPCALWAPDGHPFLVTDVAALQQLDDVADVPIMTDPEFYWAVFTAAAELPGDAGWRVDLGIEDPRGPTGRDLGFGVWVRNEPALVLLGRQALASTDQGVMSVLGHDHREICSSLTDAPQLVSAATGNTCGPVLLYEDVQAAMMVRLIPGVYYEQIPSFLAGDGDGSEHDDDTYDEELEDEELEEEELEEEELDDAHSVFVSIDHAFIAESDDPTFEEGTLGVEIDIPDNSVAENIVRMMSEDGQQAWAEVAGFTDDELVIHIWPVTGEPATTRNGPNHPPCLMVTFCVLCHRQWLDALGLTSINSFVIDVEDSPPIAVSTKGRLWREAELQMWRSQNPPH